MAVGFDIGPSEGGVRMRKGGEEKKMYVLNTIKSAEDP